MGAVLLHRLIYQVCITLSFFAGFVLAGQPAAAAAAAKAGSSIAVVVNDRAITHDDIAGRMGLIIASSGLPNTPETQKRILPQIVSGLIDEELQMAEAEKMEISASDEDIAQEFSALAQSNKMSAAQFKEVLDKSGVDVSSLYDQIEARLVWADVFKAKLGRQAQISDSEIDSYLEFLETQVGKTEYLLSEIFLPVDQGTKENDVKQLAGKIVQDLQAGKAAFTAMAQQLSKAPGAQNGGSLGWMQLDQMDGDVAKVLQDMPEKSLSKPIRSVSGYHIFYLAAKRTITQDNIPDRDQVRSMLFQKRAEQVSRSYLQSLRQSALIQDRL